MSRRMDNYTKGIAAISATIAAFGGGYSFWTSVEFDNPILSWSPEHFEISDGPANGEFKVAVAREKHRDDCTVEDFILDVKDSEYIVHTAVPSITKFMGPANDRVDTFAYTMTIENPEKVASGLATLIAYIHYDCPEGKVVVQYPDHENLTFNVEDTQ